MSVRIAKAVPVKCEWTPGCRERAVWTVDHMAYCQRHAEYAAFYKLAHEQGVV